MEIKQKIYYPQGSHSAPLLFILFINELQFLALLNFFLQMMRNCQFKFHLIKKKF